MRTMKKEKLVLSKETLRALSQEQLSGINGRVGGTVTNSVDIDCFTTVNSFFKCP